MLKKLLSVLLAFLIVCSLLPFTAFASGTDIFPTKPEIEIPDLLKSAVTTIWDPNTNLLTATIKDGITDEQWAFLFSYFSHDGEISLHCDFDFPEGTVGFVCSDEGQEDSFEDFQTDAESHVGEEGYYWDLKGDRSVGRPIVLADYTVEGNEVTITPRNRKNGYEYFAWVNDQNEIISCSKFDIEVVINCEASYTYDIDGLLPSENRRRLEEDEFFKCWDEEKELLKSFKQEENPGNMDIDISFGGSSELPEGIECEFVDGILEIKIGKLEPEDLAKAYDVFSAAQGELYLDISIKLPEEATKFADGRGNGSYFEVAKDDIKADIESENFKECDPEEDNYARFKYNIGRLVKDGDQVLFFPESNSGLDFEFIGYRLENEEEGEDKINYAALVMNVYSTPEARIVSFKDPIAPMPVDVSQIEVDEDYWEKMAGRDYGEGNVYEEAEYGNPNYKPNYNSETGTLTYVYQGEGTTEEEIIDDFNSNDITGNSETSTIIKAPDGYNLFKLYDANGEEMGFDANHPESVSVFCPFVRDEHLYNRNMRYTFLWRKLADGSFLYQEIYVTNDFKNKLTYFDIYWEVPKEEQVKIRSEKQGFVSLEELAESGIIVDIDWESGYVHTSFEGENPDLNKFGECVAFIMPPEEATHFKANNGGGNTEFPPSYDQDRADERKRFFDSAAEFEKIEGDLEDPYYWLPNLPVLIYDSASVGDITYYYSSFISTEHLIVEWYGGEEESAELIAPKDGKRGYFLYLKMDDLSFVTTTTGIEENEINENVKYPTVVKSNGSNEKWFLKTEIAPQNSESQAKLFDLKAQFETAPEEMTRIFIPYSAIDFKGDIESNNFQFKITHYDGCENLAALEDYLKDNKGVQVACEYDEYGIYFYTDSFSPFVFEFEDLGLKNPEEPEKYRHSSDTVVIGAKNADEKKAEEENPDTGALVPGKAVRILTAGMILSFAAMALSKKK